MPQQLIYTSAPRGVVAGRSGYCTVARSATMREALMLRLEQLSYYTHLSLSGGREHPIFAYRIVDIRGTRFHVLSRIQDAGLDFTGRTNFIAHHLVFTPEEISQLASPALILNRWPGWLNAWTKEPQSLEREDWSGLMALGNVTCLPAKTWAEITGDTANGYGLLEAKPGSCFAVDAAMENRTLALLAESSELSEAREQRGNPRATPWQYTFTTSLQEQDNPADFRWRLVHANNPAFAKLAGASCPLLSSVRAASCSEAERAFARQGRKAPMSVAIETKQRNVVEGATARFEANSDGVPQPTFQWFEIEGGKAIKLEGQTGPALEVTARGRSKRYMVRATNSLGSQDSRIVELSITQPEGRRQKLAPKTGGGTSWDDAPSVVPKYQKSGSEIDQQRNRLLADQAEKTWRRKKGTQRIVIISVSTLLFIGALAALMEMKNKPVPKTVPDSTNQPPPATVVATNPLPAEQQTNVSATTPTPNATNAPPINAQSADARAKEVPNTNSAPIAKLPLSEPIPIPPSLQPLPDSWKTEKIGTLGVLPTGGLDKGDYLITGAGMPFLSASDNFTFICQKVSGDGELSASFAGFDSAPPSGARAGIMIRGSTSASAAFFFIGMTSGQGVVRAFREQKGNTAKEMPVPGNPKKLKFRLVRSGKKLECHCDFGAGEFSVEVATIGFPSNNFTVGLVLASGALDRPLAVKFADVKSTFSGETN